MVELASVKILHELRCHEVFEDMDDVTRYPDFVHFCFVTQPLHGSFQANSAVPSAHF